jgi:acyl-CoA thioester hydrolase
MARIKLALPEAFKFETDIPVRITDINYGGHLGNDSVLAIIHEARVRFLKSLGYSEMDVEGAGLIQSDAVIVFKSEGFYGDIVNAKVAVDDFSATGCDFLFLLTNRETGAEIVRAKTGIVFYDYENKKLLKVPASFKQALN